MGPDNFAALARSPPSICSGITARRQEWILRTVLTWPVTVALKAQDAKTEITSSDGPAIDFDEPRVFHLDRTLSFAEETSKLAAELTRSG